MSKSQCVWDTLRVGFPFFEILNLNSCTTTRFKAYAAKNWAHHEPRPAMLALWPCAISIIMTLLEGKIIKNGRPANLEWYML